MKRFAALLPVLALVACASLHSPPADAGTSSLTWTNPITNADAVSSPIVDDGVDETSLASWRIEYGTCSAPNVFGVKAGEVTRARVAGQPSPTAATLNTQSGLKCFRVYVTNRAGNESGASNVASRTVEAPTPKSPTNVTASP